MKRCRQLFLPLLGILVLLGVLHLGAADSRADQLDLVLTVPAAGVKSGVYFPITVTALNHHATPMSFNQVVLVQTKPDFTVYGPFVLSTATRTVPAGTRTNPGKITFTLNNARVSSTAPAGTLLPLLMSVWQGGFGPQNMRGGGFTAVKLLAP